MPLLHVLAAEGGYQAFELDSTDWAWLIFSAVTAVIAILVGFYLVRAVNAAGEATPKSRMVAGSAR